MKHHARPPTEQPPHIEQPAAEPVADVSADGDTPREAEVIAAAAIPPALVPVNRFLTHFPLNGVRFDFIEKPIPGVPYGEGKQLNTVPVRMAEVWITLGDTEAAIPCAMILQQGADKENRCKVLYKKVGQKVSLQGVNKEYDDASGNTNRGFKLQWPSKGRLPYITPFVKVTKGSVAEAEMNAFSQMVVKQFKIELKERNHEGKQNPINWDLKTVASVEGPGSVGITTEEADDLGID